MYDGSMQMFDGGVEGQRSPVVGESSVGSTGRDGLKAGLSAVFLFAGRTLRTSQL